MPILEWLNKGEATKITKKLPYRILKANAKLSYGDKSENMIIKGDNLEALQALLPYYKGQVKCIYIDPPYNTGNAFEHYDDNLEHSTWLSLIYPRLCLLHELLSEDGFICCQIDDAEGHYLKVLMDEIFGRNNYLTTFYMQVRYSNKTLAEDSDYQKVVEQCHIYAKSKALAKVNRPTAEYDINKFEWEIIELEKGQEYTLGNKRVVVFKPEQYRINKIKPSLTGLKETWATGSLSRVRASAGEFFELYLSERKNLDGLGCLYKVYGIGEDGLGYRYISGPKKETASKGKFYSGIPLNRLEELKTGKSLRYLPVSNFYDFAGAFGNCRLEGGVGFKGGKKPEILIKTLLDYFTNVGDLVLDSFMGSGSTISVAQKMGRRYIGIEMGEHAITHCVPRMRAVIDGEQGGVSKAVRWQGGGGYTFYDLGETIFDENGNINKQVDFKTLASHVWFMETKTSLSNYEKSPLLGICNDTAYYLLYNGILGDKKPDGGNVLTQKIFDTLPKFEGKKVIYGEATRMSVEKLRHYNITFKQTPYEIKGRWK